MEGGQHQICSLTLYELLSCLLILFYVFFLYLFISTTLFLPGFQLH